MAISFKIKDQNVFAKLESSIKDKMEKVLASEQLLDEVGNFVTDRIRYQARISKPINSQNSFPNLKPSTIANREYLSQFNNTHETYDAGRSNLTFTGQLLDSIKHRIKSAGVIVLEFTGNHRGYKTGSGKLTKSLPNSKIARYLSEIGFDIFDKALKDNKQVKARIRSIVLRYLRRGLDVSRRLRS